jgi:hypothetical protein
VNSPLTISPVATFAGAVLIARVYNQRMFTVAEFFTALSLITLLTDPLGYLLGVFSQYAAAVACFDRIQKYLLLPDRIDMRKPITLIDNSVVIEEATFKSNSRIFLIDINLQIPRGSLTIITGPVASGKSMLLKSILGEFFTINGSIFVENNIAFCDQESWIRHVTVRENVIGQSIYEAEWFDRGCKSMRSRSRCFKSTRRCVRAGRQSGFETKRRAKATIGKFRIIFWSNERHWHELCMQERILFCWMMSSVRWIGELRSVSSGA